MRAIRSFFLVGIALFLFWHSCCATEVSISKLDLFPQQIKADRVDLNVIVNIDNKGSIDAKNVSVIIKAFDPNTEYMKNKSSTISAGTIEKGKTKNVTAPITLPRKGSYDLLAVLYENGTEVQDYPWDNRNLEIPYVEIIKPEFKIRNIEDFNNLVQLTIYVKNAANKKIPNLNITARAKIKDTDQIIDEDKNITQEINPQAITIVGFTLKVPEKYKTFIIDITIWEKDICIKNDQYEVTWKSDDSGNFEISGIDIVKVAIDLIPIVSKVI